jgi:AmmeMemoRadiSam system protein B
MKMSRSPAVAGQFYPGTAAALVNALQGLVPAVDPAAEKEVIGVISPHAGYMYSGAVAGETIGQVRVPEDVVILGPNHTGHGAPIALMDSGSWDMPMGEVPVNSKLAGRIAAGSAAIEIDEAAHRFEHSLEVQVPFLQYRQKNLAIAPLVVSHVDYDTCVDVGRAIAAAIRDHGRPVLIVASTDMTHYESRQSASAKDSLALERIRALDPEGLYNTVTGKRFSMCGIMPTTVALVAALALGASRAELVRYTDSGETSGDTDHVVGYAGLLLI